MFGINPIGVLPIGYGGEFDALLPIIRADREPWKTTWHLTLEKANARAVMVAIQGLSPGNPGGFTFEQPPHIVYILPDNTPAPALELPLSSFQFRLESDPATSTLDVVVPGGVEYATKISDFETAHPGSQLVIRRVVKYRDGSKEVEEVARVTFERWTYDRGGRSNSASLGGSMSMVNGLPKVVYLTGLSYTRRSNTGANTYRCSPSTQIRPGDTAVIDGESFVVKTMAMFMAPTASTFELTSSATATPLI
jgi:hypothetical protein